MIAAVFQAGPYILPSFHPHPYWALGFAAIGGILTAYAAFSAKQPPINIHSDSHPIVSPTISPNIAPVFAPVFHNHASVAPSIQVQEDTPKPNLSFVKDSTVFAGYDGHAWREHVDEVTMVMVVEVENKLRTDQQITAAKRVSASIRFIREDGIEVGYIERAFWVGYEENAIDISFGEVRSIVIGTYADSRFSSYKNTRTRPLSYHQFMSGGHEANLSKIDFVLAVDVRAEVIVFSSHGILAKDTFKLRKMYDNGLQTGRVI